MAEKASSGLPSLYLCIRVYQVAIDVRAKETIVFVVVFRVVPCSYYIQISRCGGVGEGLTPTLL